MILERRFETTMAHEHITLKLLQIYRKLYRNFIENLYEYIMYVTNIFEIPLAYELKHDYIRAQILSRMIVGQWYPSNLLDI